MSKSSRPDLVAIGSAAVLAVYAAGYIRTRAAAQLFAQDVGERRRPMAPPVTQDAPSPISVAKTPGRATTVTLPKPASKPDAPRPDSSAPPAPTATAAPVVAAAPTPEPTPAPAADSVVAEKHVAWRDGVYTGWGTSRHGNIQASVEVKDGRIIAATITQCLTRYSCSWISALPGQVVTRQSPEVDYVSGATQSTNAFYWAVVEALKQAK